MFETAELGRTLSKEEYTAAEPELRTELLDLQRQLHRADFPVIVLVNGVDGAGKGAVINMLNEWMDTRNIQTTAFDAPTEEERHRPPYWRYWMALPPKGRIGIFTGAWYTQPIIQRAYGFTDDAAMVSALLRINRFERMLADDGALFVKLWLHISKEHQATLFRKLAKKEETRWRVTKQDRKHAKLYDTFMRVSERALRETSTGEAPWCVVEGTDPRYRAVTVARQLARSISRRLGHERPRPLAPQPPIADPFTILDRIDLTQSLSKEDYRRQLERLQGRLNGLARRARKRNVSVILVLEGLDAAGKGGAIRRIIEALDARQFRVIQVAAPTEEERQHHYLWRFWRHLPRLGRFTIYDRSWYGRVLVERVEGFATEAEWMRSYKEINDFEEQLVEFGIVLCKFWVHISSEEQLRRFEDRERIPWKQYKITDEDYRNRDKANQYEAAASEMIERTSTEYARWNLVASEDKRFGRIQILETVCQQLEAALARAGDT